MADGVDLAERRLDDEHAFVGLAHLRDDLAVRAGDEGRAPELEPAAVLFCLGVRLVRRLEADAVHADDVDAVRDRVAAHRRDPGVALRVAVLVLLVRVPADGRRVEEAPRSPGGP